MKRKVADADANADESQTKPNMAPFGRSRRKNSGGKRADRQLLEFFNNIGSAVVEFIDATPFGVSTPEPWSPSTDKKKAMLSNPISVLNTVGETIDALSPSEFLGGAAESGSAWMIAPSNMLISLREGLANAVLAEEAMGEEEEVNFEGKMVTVEVPEPVDATVSSEAGCEDFVSLGDPSRTVNPVKEAITEAKTMKNVTLNKIMAFIDRFTLRTNGIVVTSDDCSVECSLDSLVEALSPSSSVPGSVSCDDDFEDCPSVVTELAINDLEEDFKVETETEVVPTEIKTTEQTSEEETQAQEMKTALIGDEEYVITEEPDSEEEDDFVDVGAEFDVVHRS